MYSRYAVFYLPPSDSPLADFGAQWFGYDIRTGKFREPIQTTTFDLKELTKISHRYGLHATLKAPFRLKKKYDLSNLFKRVEKQASKSEPFTYPSMKITQLAGFPALMPKHNRAKMVHLEERLVHKLNKFGKKPDQSTSDRRRKVKLNALEQEYFRLYGYPYVLDHFRFHLTLCDKAERSTRSVISSFLEENYSEVLTSSLEVREIAVVGERKSDGYFEELERFALRSGFDD